MQPVGAFPIDLSPFGMRDAVGGLTNWATSATSDQRPTNRGGSWNRRDESCSTYFRWLPPVGVASASVGVRFAYGLRAK